MTKIKIVLSAAFLSLAMIVSAQTVNEAGEAFNNGINAQKEKNYAAAVEAYASCIEIADQLDDEGMDLKMKAEGQIPGAYYSLGLQQYKAKQFDEAINSFEKAIETSQVVGKADIEEKSNEYISKVNYTKGMTALKGKKYDQAVADFDASLKADPTYFKSFYGKGLAYRGLDNSAEFKAAMDKAIELGPEGDKTVAKAKSVARKYFRDAGAKKLQAQKAAEAVELINQSFEYGTNDAQAYYFLTLAHNSLSQWDKAIEAGNNAATYEKKSKSNIFFELGKAYEAAGNAAKACESYKQVVDGGNVEAAKYQMTTVLKCN